MKSIIVLLFASVVVVFVSVFTVSAQKKAKLGRVCGDPTVACKPAENFQAYDLPFDTGKNFVIAESEWFYGIVLQSKKLKNYGDCEHPTFSEKERMDIQQLFPKNKVFSLNCVESGTNYYKGVAQETAFIGLFAGRTLTAANAFLKMVLATKRFSGIRVRKMQVAVNGT